MITRPGVIGVRLLLTTTPTFSVAGTRHMPEIMHYFGGGAIVVSDNCTISWNRETIFSSHTTRGGNN